MTHDSSLQFSECQYLFPLHPHLPQDGRMPYRDGNVNIPDFVCIFQGRNEARVSLQLWVLCLCPDREAAGSRNSAGFLLPWPSLLAQGKCLAYASVPALISAPPPDDLNSCCSMNFWETQGTTTQMNYCWDNSAHVFSQPVMTIFKSSHSLGQGKPSRAFTLLNLLSKETGSCTQST